MGSVSAFIALEIKLLRIEPIYCIFFLIPFVETLFSAKMRVFGALLLAGTHLHLRKTNPVSCSNLFPCVLRWVAAFLNAF